MSIEPTFEITAAGTLDSTISLLLHVVDRLKRTDDHFVRALHEKGSDPSTVRITLDPSPTSAARRYMLQARVVLLQFPGPKTEIRIAQGDWPAALVSCKTTFTDAMTFELTRRSLSRSPTPFESSSLLENIRLQLGAAEDATAYANIGNACLLAIIALANELYKPFMLPGNVEPPKGDDARQKLKYVARCFAPGQAARQNDGLDDFIAGTWKLITQGSFGYDTGLKHRQHATRIDAEVAVVLTNALFEAFGVLTRA